MLKTDVFNTLMHYKKKGKFCQMSWIRTQRAAVASRHATNLATHFPISLQNTPSLQALSGRQVACQCDLHAILSISTQNLKWA
jgi:hypothetical protein